MLKMYEFNLKDAQVILKPQNNIEKVYIELSSDCNLHCEMCFRNSFREKFGKMKLETFYNIFEGLKEMKKVKEVIFGGIGEPLTNPHFKEMAKFVKDKGYKLLLESNGYLITEEMLNFFFSISIDEFIFSAEPGEAGHGTYSWILDLTRKISDRIAREKLGKPIVTIQTVLSTKNVQHIEDFFQKFVDAGASRFILSNIIPTSEKELSLPLYIDPKEGMENYISRKITGKISTNLPYFDLKTERYCNFTQNNAVVIRWDGEVAPCYRFLHSYTEYVYGTEKEIKAVSFGNVNEKSLTDIWKTEDFSYFRFKVNHALFPSCTDCRLKDGCDFVKNSDYDCWGNSPSCADCLWWRNLVICP
jgi:tungsten cofactor oxidoreducase radical SAM maturase